MSIHDTHEQRRPLRQNQIYFPDTGLCPFKFVNLPSFPDKSSHQQRILTKSECQLCDDQTATCEWVKLCLGEPRLSCQLCEIFTLKCPSLIDHLTSIRSLTTNGKLELCDTTTQIQAKKKKVSSALWTVCQFCEVIGSSATNLRCCIVTPIVQAQSSGGNVSFSDLSIVPSPAFDELRAPRCLASEL